MKKKKELERIYYFLLYILYIHVACKIALKKKKRNNRIFNFQDDA